TGSLIGGQGELIRLTVVFDDLASPDLPTDVYELAGAGQRLVEGDTVPTLDDLGPRAPDSENEASARHGVEAGRGHGGEGRGAGVDRQDPRGELDPFGVGG